MTYFASKLNTKHKKIVVKKIDEGKHMLINENKTPCHLVH